MPKQEDFHRPKKPLEKTREIDNEATISKEAEMKKNIEQRSEAHNFVRHPAKLSNILALKKKPMTFNFQVTKKKQKLIT